MSTPPAFASFLPPGTGACVINLDSRPDRWQDFQAVILPALRPLPVHRIPAVLGTAIPGFGQKPFFRGKKRDRTWAGRAGCTLSHRAALSHALDCGWSHALILEDDVALHPSAAPTALGSLSSAFADEPLDLCYLGFADPFPPFRHLGELGTSGHTVHRIFGANTTHAYLVSARAARLILNLLPNEAGVWPWLARHRAIDRFYRRNLSARLRISAVSPPLFDQAAGHSDITGREADAPSGHHVSSIPTSAVSAASFRLAVRHRLRRTRRENAWDAARGLVKRLKGF